MTCFYYTTNCDLDGSLSNNTDQYFRVDLVRFIRWFPLMRQIVVKPGGSEFFSRMPMVQA